MAEIRTQEMESGSEGGGAFSMSDMIMGASLYGFS
jgi:hypothetical protein